MNIIEYLENISKSMVKSYKKLLEVMVESMKKIVGNVDLNADAHMVLDLDELKYVELSPSRKTRTQATTRNMKAKNDDLNLERKKKQSWRRSRKC